MSCDFGLLKSRNLNCRNGIAGLKNVYFIPNVDDGLTLDSSDEWSGGEITSGDLDVYRFRLLNDGNSYEETIASDQNNGTTVFQGALTLALPVLDRETRDVVQTLAFTNPHIVIETFSGQFILIGAGQGVNANGGSLTTGAAKVDFTGYNLTFASEERKMASWLTQAGITVLRNAVDLTDEIFPSGDVINS